MADKISVERRSENMRQIRSKDTKPELLVRQMVHGMGYRYRLHAKDLPGKPDLVFRKRRKVIFVHGCFWHGHELETCLDSRKPKSNTAYWNPKLERNKARDAERISDLQAAGWDVMVIWDCDLKQPALVADRLRAFLDNFPKDHEVIRS
jgi:DNA mismatch endonuclease (patch repair protein)